MWDMHDAGWAWWTLSSIGMLAVWTAVIYGIYLLIRSSRDERSREDEPEPPDAILKRRLAAGEIGVDEYEHLREVLAGEPPRMTGTPVG
jgi:uncharacterized membrane protein